MENLVLAVFSVESEAYQAFAELESTPYHSASVISQGALVKQENGHLTILQNYGSGMAAMDDTLNGGLIGSIVGILGGPIGMLLGLGVGSLVGSAVDAGDVSVGTSLIENIAGKMPDNSTALILLTQETDEKLLDARLAKFSPTISRWDAAQVAQQVRQAQQLEQETRRHVRQELYQQKGDEFKKKVEECRAALRTDFDSLKQKLSRTK